MCCPKYCVFPSQKITVTAKECFHSMLDLPNQFKGHNFYKKSWVSRMGDAFLLRPFQYKAWLAPDLSRPFTIILFIISSNYWVSLNITWLLNFTRTMYWLGVASLMILTHSINSLKRNLCVLLTEVHVENGSWWLSTISNMNKNTKIYCTNNNNNNKELHLILNNYVLNYKWIAHAGKHHQICVTF